MLEHITHTASCLGGGHDRAGAFGDDTRALLVVADGAGGQTGAALAADMVLELTRAVAERHDRPIGPVGLRALLARLDRTLLSHGRAGQSTAVLIEVWEDRFWGASVGDSGAWLVLEGDHIELTHAQHRKWRLGTGLATPVSFGPLPLIGTLVVASDGLFECATPERVTSAVQPGPMSDIVGSLASRVRAPDGTLRDDLAIALCRRAAPALARSA